MICSKCNSEISDGARFCTVCGAAFGTASDVRPIEAPKEPEKKWFCTKCGLELQFGAKFCTKCGTPAANVKDITPAVNDGQTFGNGNMAAVSLEKQTNANDLVAAMPAPAAAPAPAAEPVPTPVAAAPAPAAEPVPTPVAAAPAPTAVPVPTPVAAAPAPAAAPVPTPVAAAPAPAAAPVLTPVAAAPAPAAEPVPTPVAAAPAPAAAPVPTPVASYNGVASVAAPAAPIPPEFAPPPAADSVSAMGGDVNGLNGAAAASVAVPVKKKGKGGKIALIIGIVLAVLIGAAAVFFFTNKATALSLVMGKPKYAAMVEKESLKKAAENLDMETLSDQINSVSVIASTYANNSYRMPMLSMSNTNSEGAQFAKLMSSSMGGYGDFDIDSLLKSYSDIMKSTYGAARISGSVTVNAEFGSEFDDAEYADFIKNYINGKKINYDFAATEQTLGFAGGIDFNGNPIDLKFIMENDGSLYLAFPFVSDKAVKIKIPTNNMTRSSAATTAGLDIDAKELERIINDLIDIYTDTIKDSTVTMEKGSLIVAGSEITGKKMVVELDGKSAEKLCNAVINYIANDSYLCGQLASYLSGLGLEVTPDELKSELEEAKVEEGTFNTDEKLVITSILTNNGDVLAKSYMFDEAEIAYAANDKETKFEIKAEEKTVFSLSSVKSSDKDGETEIKVAVKDDQVIRVVMTYTGTEKAKFGNEDVMTGKYSIRVDTSEASELDEEIIDYLDGLTLDYTIGVEGSTANIDFGVDVKNLIKFNVRSDMTISDDLSTFRTPSDVIDISDLMTSGQLDEATTEELRNYLTDLMKELKNAFAGTELEGAFNEALGNIDDIIPGATVDKSKIDDLSDDVYTEMMEVYDWYRDNDVYSGDAYNNANEYQKSLRSLNERISKVRNNCTEEQFTEFKNEFSRLLKQKDALKKAIEAEGGNENGGNGETGGSMGDISFVHGTSEGNTYTSSFLGITATLDSDWQLASDSDMSKLNKINDMSAASIQSVFENGRYIYEMYASTPDSSSINITIDDTENTGIASVDEYFAVAKDLVIETFGSDCTAEEGRVIFCGKNTRCLEVTLSNDGVTVYEIQIPIVKDNYMACVTFASTNKADLKAIVNMFTAV